MIIRLVTPLFLSLLVTFTCHAASVQLPQTGQTNCYGTDALTTGKEISCAGTGQDGDMRAGVAWPNPRFVDNNGAVTDNLTGLVWLKNSNCKETVGGIARNITEARPTSGFVHKLTDAVTWANNLSDGACGLTDGSVAGAWRLPNVNELKSLMNPLQEPMLSPKSPFSGEIVNGYWTSDPGTVLTNYYGSTGAAAVIMGWDDTTDEIFPSGRDYVWPVRDGASGVVQLPRTGKVSCIGYRPASDDFGTISCLGSGYDAETLKGAEWPSPRFHDNKNGTITDLLTGLIWTKRANCTGDPYAPTFTERYHAPLSMPDALAYARNLKSGLCYLTDGSSPGDWRLPNINELYSLVDLETKRNPEEAISLFEFIEGTNWSSTTYLDPVKKTTYAFFTDLTLGVATSNILSATPVAGTVMTFRPVRGGVIGDAVITGLPATSDFGNVLPGGSASKTIPITNGSSSARMQVSAIILSGPDSAEFALDLGDGTNGTCGGIMPFINPGANCTVSISFNPTTFGVKTASLQIIATNASSIALTGSALISGACGTANGRVFNTAPLSNLCISGTSSALSGTGPWTWTCNGEEGGANASCSANIASFALTFAAGAHGSLTGTTSQTINYGGSATTITATPDPTYAFANWTEGATVVSTNATLTVSNVAAAHNYTANFVVNYGVCSTSNGGTFPALPTGLCDAGTVTALSGTGPWSWQCVSAYGGASANCSANIRTYTVTPSAGALITMAPTTPLTINHGDRAAFTVTAPAGYGIINSGCGGTLSGTDYTSAVITADCSASFSAVPRNANGTGSGQPSLQDAMKAMYAYSGKQQLSATEKILYDVAPLGSTGFPAGNGVVDYADIILILRRIVGIGSW